MFTEANICFCMYISLQAECIYRVFLLSISTNPPRRSLAYVRQNISAYKSQINETCNTKT